MLIGRLSARFKWCGMDGFVVQSVCVVVRTKCGRFNWCGLGVCVRVLLRANITVIIPIRLPEPVFQLCLWILTRNSVCCSCWRVVSIVRLLISFDLCICCHGITGFLCAFVALVAKQSLCRPFNRPMYPYSCFLCVCGHCSLDVFLTEWTHSMDPWRAAAHWS
jgi:hypothetical protein